MTGDWLSLVVVAALLASVLGVAEALRRLGVEAEVTRKLMHVATGLVAAAFPWLFESGWSVLALGGAFAALLATARSRGRLLSIHGVGRRTAGELWMPAGVALTFAVAGDRPAAYVPALLVLALGDSAAAFAGRALGRRRYRVAHTIRTVEGSLTLALCALPCVVLPLLLLTSLPWRTALVWGTAVAALAACVEALAPSGSDNLALPLAVGLALAPVGAGIEPIHDAVSLLLLSVVVLASVARPAPPRRSPAGGWA